MASISPGLMVGKVTSFNGMALTVVSSWPFVVKIFENTNNHYKQMSSTERIIVVICNTLLTWAQFLPLSYLVDVDG